MIRYQIVVEGRVQGVGYRAFASRAAKSLGLYGFVRNMPNGSVLIEAEGPEDVLQTFVKMCKSGPGWAHVNHIHLTSCPAQNDTDFKITY